MKIKEIYKPLKGQSGPIVSLGMLRDFLDLYQEEDLAQVRNLLKIEQT